MDETPGGLLWLTETAEQLDALADAAALMGDEAGEARWREMAVGCRMQAMRLLDD